ncbi:MFS transporter [Streptomyces sp. XM4193]|uniref:MFS transporter n=1 Tax=Streptomyces sp. XM4193 TaxID=2929782 RepID=UPI001FF92F98|nr:MFS transporter [Streptomyces sp. XM4193]MCK1794631.1 MFS transporter [Streptomyces sp. XM4193]
MAEARTGSINDARTLLHFRDFRRLLAVRLTSQLSDGVYQVALAGYVVFSPESETSPGAIAAAMAVLLLPYSLLGPFVGVLLDRWKRRQVLLYGNVLRAVFAALTAALIVASVPTWLFYLSALCVTAVNRFVLAGLSASLPRVVDEERLVIANSVSPTAGTLAATLGGGVAIAIRVVSPDGAAADALVVLAAAAIYLLSAGTALRLQRDQLGPDPSFLQPRLRAALTDTARGLLMGLRHLRRRSVAAKSLAAVTLLRFCYGALTVMLLMLCRYAWSDDVSDGMALLGVALGLSGVGFFAAAVITPWAAQRFGRLGYMALCAAAAAVLTLVLCLPFHPAPMLAAAFFVGMATQSAKICTDTVVQSEVEDGFRGRVFALYDMLYNVAFVGAAAVAAVILPPDGRSPSLVVLVAVLYGGTALAVRRFARD